MVQILGTKKQSENSSQKGDKFSNLVAIKRLFEKLCQDGGIESIPRAGEKESGKPRLEHVEDKWKVNGGVYYERLVVAHAK
jgi:hypothetical protein